MDDTKQARKDSLPEIRVLDYSVVLQSALNGRGVALGFITSCGYFLQEALFELALSVSLKTGKDYCVVTSANPSNQAVVNQVSDWLNEKLKNSLNSFSKRMLNICDVELFTNVTNALCQGFLTLGF